tara:strand:- start:1844 stop:2485 length:642 start_codon:yes stop_codon:yes gene_type:complete
MEEIYKNYSLLNQLDVPRETFFDFETLISLISEKNRDLNIISKKNSQISFIRDRHIIDSAQIIEFVDLNSNTTSDIGTGGGMPGLVLAIMLKNLKKKMKFNLYEKSYHKSIFLKEASRKLNLDTEIIQKDIFSITKIKTGTIMARAFKPLPVVLELVYKNFISYKNLILFMGRNGRETLKQSLKDWDFEYLEKKSVTSENSFLLNIKNIRKKI